MALPQGFDPKSMSFGKTPAVINIPKTSSTYTRRPSLWSRFNEAIGNFGNWIADASDTIINVMAMIGVGAIILVAIIAVITTWVQEGFFMALLAGVIAYIVGYIGIGIAWLVINVVMNILLFVLRFLFWSGWTLLLGVGGLIVLSLI